MICPDCGGAMWDNRPKKASGQYKATRSDFSCKDKDGCGKGVWLKDGEAAPPAPQRNGNGNGNGATPRPTGGALAPLYLDCLDTANKAVRHVLGDTATTSDVIAAAATLFIQSASTGRPIRAPKPAPPPPPPPPPPAPEPVYDPYTDERDLPF